MPGYHEDNAIDVRHRPIPVDNRRSPRYDFRSPDPHECQISSLVSYMRGDSLMKRVRIAIIGETTIADDGNLSHSGAIARALKRIPETDVTLRVVAPDQATATALNDALAAFGITGVVSQRDGPGEMASIRNGDTLDIWGLFDHDIVIMDFNDPALRLFLTDLPAHTKPDVHLFGTLNYVQGPLSSFERDVAMRFDTVVGDASQFKRMSGADDALMALTEIHDCMRGVNLRAAVLVEDRGSLTIAVAGEPFYAIPLTSDSPSLDLSTIIAHTAVCVARRAEWSTIADSLAAGVKTVPSMVRG
jgi:hypothetical protein